MRDSWSFFQFLFILFSLFVYFFVIDRTNDGNRKTTIQTKWRQIRFYFKCLHRIFRIFVSFLRDFSFSSLNCFCSSVCLFWNSTCDDERPNQRTLSLWALWRSRLKPKKSFSENKQFCRQFLAFFVVFQSTKKLDFFPQNPREANFFYFALLKPKNKIKCNQFNLIPCGRLNRLIRLSDCNYSIFSCSLSMDEGMRQTKMLFASNATRILNAVTVGKLKQETTFAFFSVVVFIHWKWIREKKGERHSVDAIAG